jgi:flagellar basal body-associated protein FliL
MTKKKIIIILVVVLAGGGYAAKTFLLKAPVVKMKVNGVIYGLPKQFTLNMAGGRYATLTVALILPASQDTGASAASAGTPSPDGFGTLPEEPIVRAIVTNLITNQDANTLLTQSGRAKLQEQILLAIRKQTDIKIDSVVFPDVAVQ